MFIKQLSVFIENKVGKLAEILNVLSENNIDISALSIAETTEFGILRMIVSDPEAAKVKLRESGVIVKTTNVIGVVLDDTPGSMAKVITLLSENGITVEYSYAFLASNKGALIVIRTNDHEKTEKVLNDTGIGLVNPAEVYRV
ncbi:MAG: ACT domain-containing protein [Monoglobales bacterium]